MQRLSSLRGAVIVATASTVLWLDSSSVLAAGAVAADSTPIDGALEEIVVTARRRAEPIENTPVAVTALSGAQLETQQVDRLDQVADYVPNLTFQPGAPTGGGPSTPSVFIRGVGSSETSLGSEPGVGLYVDDVYIARSVGSVLDLADIASVQVLRGPQGTLFGRNNIGGAIVIRSAPLSSELTGNIRLATGSEDRREVRASMDIPFGDHVKTRLGAIVSDRNGYVRNVDSSNSKDDFGRTNRVAFSGAIEWQPTDSLVVTARGDHTNDHGTAAPSVLLALVPAVPGTGAPSMIQAISNLKGTCFGASVLANSGNPDCIDQQWILGPFKSHNGYSTQNPIFDSQGSEAYANRTRSAIGGGSLSIAWSLNDSVKMKSITAYRDINAFWPSNSDHSPDPGIETKVDFSEREFTQEIQVLGDSFSNRLHWIVGGYSLDESGSELNVVAFPAVIFRSGGGYATKSTAGFAQASFQLTESLELTGGGRLTHERKSYDTLSNQEIIGVLLDPFTTQFQDLRATPIPFVTGSTPDIKSNVSSPYASLKYRLNPALMVYASYSDGYKSGGYEQRLAPGTPEVPRFGPERLHMVELGAKVRLWDGRLNAAAALFHSKYKDMQITVVDGVSPTMTNAGDATIKGGELEISGSPVKDLILGANAGYTGAAYNQLTARALASGITLGSALPNTPRIQAGLSAQYKVLVTPKLALTPFINATYRSQLFVDSENTPLLRQGGFGKVDAGMAFSDRNDRWALTLSGRNLTNKAYLVSGLAQYSIGEIEGTFAPPRQWDLTLHWNF